MILWRRNRAQHKQRIKKCKRESWIEFIETVKQKAPSSTLHQAIRRIKGKVPRKTNILEENGHIYTKVPKIVHRFAETFSNVSSNNNYLPEFQLYKEVKERETIDLNINNDKPYNKNVTIEDLEYSLASASNTAPGSDAIHYKMIKRMPENAKIYLCQLFNKFKETLFPSNESSKDNPFTKTRQSHSISNYRPIALTSCLCKTFERMINERLAEYLEMNSIQYRLCVFLDMCQFYMCSKS